LDPLEASISGVSVEWLEWARRLQAIAQSGLAYAEDPYDVERYEQVRRIAAEIAASRSGTAADSIDALFSEGTSYATPKVDTRAVVLDEEGAVLLVREKEDGLWTLLPRAVGGRGRVPEPVRGEGGQGGVRLRSARRQALGVVGQE
jgi:hypothetical protein